MTPPPRAYRSRRLLGFACIAAAIVLPLVWAVANFAADPEFSMSDAEAVYDYTVAHTQLTPEQTKVLSDGVRHAHGGTHASGYLVRWLPWCLPLLLLISGTGHLSGGGRDEGGRA